MATDRRDKLIGVRSLLARGRLVAEVKAKAGTPLTEQQTRQLSGPRPTSAQSLEQQIADHLRASEAAGELQAAPSWGKPMQRDDAYLDTPEELRVGFKALKTAGFLPQEVLLMRGLAELKRQLQAAPEGPQAAALRSRIADLQQQLALRMENLRGPA